MDWSLFFIAYFSFSAFLVFANIFLRRRAGMETNVTVAKLFFGLLFSPLLTIVTMVLDALYPPSGNPVEIIYSKLSYTEGKRDGTILGEIWAAQETLGWGEVPKLEFYLDMMTHLGYAKKKMSAMPELVEGVTSLANTVGDIAASLVPANRNSGKENQSAIDSELEKLQEAAEKLATLSHGFAATPVYFKGLPPRKRKLKIWLSRLSWQPVPV